MLYLFCWCLIRKSMKNNYNSRNSKTLLLKILAVVFSVIFLYAAASYGISVIEKNTAASKKGDASAFGETLNYNNKEYVLKDNLETYLFLGLDKFDGEEIESYNNDKQADFLLLAVVDNETSSFTALHINRDTVTEMNILGVAGDKIGTVEKQIALAHTYGNGKEVSCRNTATAVSKLLGGVKINHYVSVTMDAVPIYNDRVGGVEVTVLDDFTGVDDTLVKGEKVTLSGQHALNYVRTRYGLDDSTNNNRMERQRQYMKALYEKTKQCVEDDKKFIENSFMRLSEYIVSDCSANRLETLMNKLSSYEFVDIYNFEGETVKGKEFMEFYPNEESVKEIAVKLFYELKD